MNTVIRGRHGYREKVIHDPLPESHWAPPPEKKSGKLWEILKYVAVITLMATAAWLWFHGPGRSVIEGAPKAPLEATQ